MFGAIHWHLGPVLLDRLLQATPELFVCFGLEPPSWANLLWLEPEFCIWHMGMFLSSSLRVHRCM